MRKLKVLIVADPLDALKPESDTSLFLAHEFLKKDFEVCWAVVDDLIWSGVGLTVRFRSLEGFELRSKPKVTNESVAPMDEFSAVMIRKDPPFDESYQRMCWMLAPYEHKMPMINKPSQLIRYHEKMLPYEAIAQGFLTEDELIPMSLATKNRDLEEFVKRFPSPSYVVKPWLGFGGQDILQKNHEELLREDFSKIFSLSKHFIVQPFVDEISEHGDRRVFFIHGHYAGSFVRLPPQGGFVSNLAQGGTAEARDLNRDQRKVIAKLEKFMHSLGIVFAGADLIGAKVSEINITSPTGLLKLLELTGDNRAEELTRGIVSSG